MRITIKYMAQIRKGSGVPEETVELAGAKTVQDFIKQNLCQLHPDLGQYILDEKGALRSIILIFHGQAKVSDAIPRELKDGDVITMMPPITGG